MSLKYDSSFSTGELDPILHDRTTLEKFRKGLATARNVIIGKTGSILSRPTRAHFIKSKNDGEKIKLYCPPKSETLLEFGNLYVRLYDFEGNLLADLAHALTESDLENMHFATSGAYVYVFTSGKKMLKLLFDDASPAFVPEVDIFAIPSSPSIVGFAGVGTPSGYVVDYLVTKVYNGEESDITEQIGGANRPITSTQHNTLTIRIDGDVSKIEGYNEIRVYRRPSQGSGYGLIGTSSYFYTSGSYIQSVYVDYGSDADFTNGPPVKITKNGMNGMDVIDFKPRTGAIYQQRLVLTSELDEEALITSRSGFHNNFFRDFPYGSDSSLKFKSGTSGNAKVLRIIENDGLIVFTTIGVYVSTGVLTVSNLALEKKGNWVIDESLPPLTVPGGVFFVDKDTNTIKQLIFSQEILTYQSVDHTIFSAHIFKRKKISSWAFQEGVTPLIWITFTDGTFASFTYDFEHEMRAWTRHDSKYSVEQSEGTGTADSTFFVTNKDNNRYIEVTLPRYVPASTLVTNSEADKSSINAFMDSLKTVQKLLNDDLTTGDTFDLVPVVSGDWEGNLTLTSGTSTIFTTGGGGLGDVGTIFKVFNTVDGSEVDLEVVSRTSDTEVVVEPSSEYPSDQSNAIRLYQTFNSITALDHLEGESVTVMVDGYVVALASSNSVVVSSGTITLPNSLRGAIIIVGRSIVADIKTLNIATAEQSPTLLESINVGKLYIRFHETRGLYISNEFPEEKTNGKDGESVEGMENLDVFDIPRGSTIIGNRYKKPASKRVEQTLPGRWKSGGQVAIRQVDPLHFEILSIIPDIEVLKRSNR